MVDDMFDIVETSLVEIVGADQEASMQQLTLYIPNKDKKDVIWEKTTILYTYIKTDNFLNNLKFLRIFLHRFGRETNQGEVVFEFDGRFFRIFDFDENDTL